MTPFKTLSLTQRTGLSVIEVLTSMVVAIIGVAGVMVLIPFAVRQAELGLDIDDANRLAQNAISQFEIGEHHRLIDGESTWVNDLANTRVNTPDAYSIDPMSITLAAPLAAPFPPLNQFPPVNSIIDSGFVADTAVPDHFPQIANVNLSTYDPDETDPTLAFTAFDEPIARKMFLTQDDLVFGEVTDDLAAPSPLYNVDSTGLNVQRQSRGELSWMSIVVPLKDDHNTAEPAAGSGAWKFRQFILVFKNREFNDTVMTLPVAEVAIDTSSTNEPAVVLSGSTVFLKTSDADVRKNDWLMLVNEDTSLESGFQKQIGFYRVIGLGNPRNDATHGWVTPITLDGPDFNLRNENFRTTAPGTDPATDIIKTYAVHLAQFDRAKFNVGTLERLGGYVVNVYERTFRLSEKSVWNK